MNERPLKRCNSYFVIETGKPRWGFIAGDYSSEGGARIGLAYWRRVNPGIEYDIYHAGQDEGRGIVRDKAA